MIQRILLVPLHWDHPQQGMSHAFRGIFPTVAEYDYLEQRRKKVSDGQNNEVFLSAATSFRPDWCFLQLQETGVLKATTLAKLRAALPKTVLSTWMGDMRSSISPYLASIIKECHLTLCSSVGQIPMFMAAGARKALYSQIGLDFNEDVLGIPNWTPPFRIPDVVFCASYYGVAFPGSPARLEAVSALLAAGIDVAVVGGAWPRGYPVVGKCGVKQQTHVYRRAKVALSVNNFNDVELFYSDRHLIALASGTTLVTKYVPGLEKEFENGKHLFWYETPDQLVATVKLLLGDENLRKQVGRQGRAEAIKNHTWHSRILSLLPHVEEEASKL